MKTAVGPLKGELAQYREMAAFAKFGSDLDISTQRLLARGERLTELLKQPQYAPLQAEEQVCVLYAGTRGYLDKIPVSEVLNFQNELLTRLRGEAGGVLEKIRVSKALPADLETELKLVLDSVAAIFA
jgi:F-type H+-transporting ATPase subunit alpha